MRLILSCLAGILVGFSKTGLPGAGILVVPVMTWIFPPKLSIGALLPMLICGDVLAVSYYRRRADWTELIGLLPGCLIGVAIGFLLLDRIPDNLLKPLMGWLVLILLAVEWLRYRLSFEWSSSGLVAIGFGGLAGFSTVIGNAAGPIIGIFLQDRNLSKERFMGTIAWFFLVVNVLKLPLFFQGGLIGNETLGFNLLTVPLIFLGAIGGIWLLPKVSQDTFNTFVYLLAAVAALQLIAS